MTYKLYCNAPATVNYVPSQAYDRGPSDHIGDSDNSNSFQHHSDITNNRNIDILAGDSDSEG